MSDNKTFNANSKLSELVACLEMATDHLSEIMLRQAIKQMLEREYGAVFDDGKKEVDSDGWIKWHGGVNPCPDQDVVVRFADGAEQAGVSCNYRWDHRHCPPSAGDVIAYRMAK